MPTRETTRRRMAKPPDERRRDLLEAARHVFADRGIAAATVSDVTDAAGVAKGTFYLYFDSKEALLGALKEAFVNDLVARATSLYSRVGSDDWWALADITVESAVDFMIEHRDLIEVFAQDGLAPRTREVFAEANRKLRNVFAAGIKAGTDAGAFRVQDPVLTATFLDRAIHGTVQHAILYEGGLDRDRVVAGARELVRRALGP